MSAGGVSAARPASQQAGGGANPTPALQDLRVLPVPIKIAKGLIVAHHYLHSLPGGSQLAFGVFIGTRLLGALILGVGSYNASSLVQGALAQDCLTLSRLWLHDDLPKNSESVVIGAALQFLKKHTRLKFLLSYADPPQGHVGTIYQATGWFYTGLSDSMPLYNIGDGKLRHSRSLAHSYGTHSVRHFTGHGVAVKLIPQEAKHRYICFLDRDWQDRLRVPVLPYPKLERSSCK